MNSYIIRQERRGEKHREVVRSANRAKREESSERLRLIREVWRAGDSAETLRRRLEQRDEYLSLRTIQRYLEKLHNTEK